jgi:hypothetical protein
MTARIAAPPGTGAEATSDERPLFVQEAADLLLVLLGSLLQALAQAAGSLGHDAEHTPCWHIDRLKK